MAHRKGNGHQIWYPETQIHFEREIWKELWVYLDHRAVHEITAVDWSFGISEAEFARGVVSIEGKRALDAKVRVMKLIETHLGRAAVTEVRKLAFEMGREESND